MTDRRDDIEAEAIGWVIRLRDSGADDWSAFTDWLEADPAHHAEGVRSYVDAGFERVACARPHTWRAVSTVPIAGERYPGVAAVQTIAPDALVIPDAYEPFAQRDAIEAAFRAAQARL